MQHRDAVSLSYLCSGDLNARGDPFPPPPPPPLPPPLPPPRAKGRGEKRRKYFGKKENGLVKKERRDFFSLPLTEIKCCVLGLDEKRKEGEIRQSFDGFLLKMTFSHINSWRIPPPPPLSAAAGLKWRRERGEEEQKREREERRVHDF